MIKKTFLTIIIIFAVTGQAFIYGQEPAKASSSEFFLKVEAKLKGMNNGDAVLVKGTTNLPSKTALYVALMADSQVIAARKQIVDGRSFTITLGPFNGKRFSPGSYAVKASFLPTRQGNKRVKEILGHTKEISATTRIMVGLNSEMEEAIGKRNAEIISEFKELESLYGEMNLEYAAQNEKFGKDAQKARLDQMNDGYAVEEEKFNKDAWNAQLDRWRAKLKKIRASDEAYRSTMVVLDYYVHEDLKMDIVKALDKLWVRYTEELFAANNLAFCPPPSFDTRDKDVLNRSLAGLLRHAKEFIALFEKQEGEKSTI